MANQNTDPAPIATRTDCIVLTGGHLKAKHDITIPVRSVGPDTFWVLHTHCEKASLLFTGVPACKRPLCNLTVFDMLRKKVAEKREERAETAAAQSKLEQEEAEEARFSFGGEHCDEIETPQKRPRRVATHRKNGRGTAVEKPVVTVSVPRYFGQDKPEIQLQVLNSQRDIGISTDIDNIQWLLEYIHAERMNSD